MFYNSYLSYSAILPYFCNLSSEKPFVLSQINSLYEYLVKKKKVSRIINYSCDI